MHTSYILCPNCNKISKAIVDRGVTIVATCPLCKASNLLHYSYGYFKPDQAEGNPLRFYLGEEVVSAGTPMEGLG